MIKLKTSTSAEIQGITASVGRRLNSRSSIRAIGDGILSILEKSKVDRKALDVALKASPSEERSLEIELIYEEESELNIDRLYYLLRLLANKPAINQEDLKIKALGLRHSCIPEDGDCHTILTISLCDDIDRLSDNGQTPTKGSKL